MKKINKILQSFIFGTSSAARSEANRVIVNSSKTKTIGVHCGLLPRNNTNICLVLLHGGFFHAKIHRGNKIRM